ncbi:MAG TPA: DUF1499 domain-containing protein [Longimicrobiaceae bacterium]|nr:DUF1499 domain-containing protein [Longimicrobiaceae bacterium]
MPITRTLADRLGILARLLRLPVPPPRPPRWLGVHDGRLAECRSPRNCVSSHGDPARGGMPPFPGTAGREVTLERVARVIASEPGARVVERTGDYLRAEFTSPLWRFVDDVEVLWDDAAGVAHFRSASRIGRADLGANRARMTRLSRRFAADEAHGG